MFTRNNYLNLAVAFTFLVCVQAAVGQSPLKDTVDTLREWVQTERMTSEAAADWESEKASIQNLISIYEEEVESLTKTIEEAEEDTSAAEVLRNQLLERRDAIKKVEAQVVAALIDAESRIKKLETVLPPPLQQELSQLFSTIPEDPRQSDIPIGQRIQPIVAILTQVQKFNQVVTLVDDFREFEQGRMVQTETIYFGLGGAFYVDQANENAGLGVPGPEGWNWTADNALIPSIREFVDIYRGTKQASYVELPVSVN